MSQIEEPQFLQDRRSEAWYRAGANTIIDFVAAIAFVVGLIVGIASLFFKIGTYQAVMATVGGTWVGLMCLSAYIEVTARNTVKDGRIEVDRF